MSISCNQEKKLFTLETKSSTYQMQVDKYGFLQHLYYGRRVYGQDMSYRFAYHDCGFSGNPHDVGNRIISLDTMPQEYTSTGVGDYRISSITAVNADGSRCASFRYKGYTVEEGKYSLPGLPAMYDNGGEALTLIITMADDVTGLELKLYYGVFEDLDIITRSVVFSNNGEKAIRLEKALSLCLDMCYGEWDIIHFQGRHCHERIPERQPAAHCITKISSTRGMSSHQHNPFVIVCDHEATETEGDCIGAMLMYSGNFEAEIEVSQMENLRLVMGIGTEGFSWKLEPGEAFTAPEAVLCYADGLTGLTHKLHRAVKDNICRGKFKRAHRPVLINSWEAMYMGVNEEKCYSLAKEAAQLGIELFVLDDGWFHDRNSDNAGLGDWYENPEKLPGGLKSLSGRVHSLGMLFGLWIEPEMVNENSDLFRTHPEWALSAPDRAPTLGREQLVLDLSRQDVVDHLYGVISKLIRENGIDYIKWDYNRCMCDVYSHALPAGSQGEVFHRYILGLYQLLERLTSEFPDVLFEGCAGGGGRFDAGLLYYTPQIWCSDDTDPIERLRIQEGTSYVYPVSSIGAHVSASPNHQTGRRTPLETRGLVAMSGAFGYELDLGRLTEDEKDEIRLQVENFHRDEELIHNGLLYRLSGLKNKDNYSAWQIVSEDRSRSVVCYVAHEPRPNSWARNVKLRGLDPEALYYIEEEEMSFTGSSLMGGGYTFPHATGDYTSFQIHLRRED